MMNRGLFYIVFLQTVHYLKGMTEQTVTININEGKHGIMGSDLLAAFFSTPVHSFIKVQFYFEEPLHPINVFRVETTDKDNKVSMELKILDDLAVLETKKDAASVSNLILGTLPQNSKQNLTIHFHGGRVSLYNFCNHLSTKTLDRSFLNVLATKPFLIKTFYEASSKKPSCESYRDVTNIEFSTSVIDALTYQDECYKKGKIHETKDPREEFPILDEYKPAVIASMVFSENVPKTPLSQLTKALKLLQDINSNQDLQITSMRNMRNEVKSIEKGTYVKDQHLSTNDALAQLLDSATKVNRDACASNPCYFLVPCFSTTDDLGYQCGDCPIGMEGDGKTCRDVDECTFNPCSPLAKCTNANPGFTCSECPPGFKGQAIYGQGSEFARNDKQVCEDRNECEIYPSVCPQHTYCNNTEGGFYCTQCIDGYVFNEFGTCVQLRECQAPPRSSKNPCSENAHCSYEINDFVGGSIKACKCHLGYAGTGFSCGKDQDYDGYPDEELYCETKLPVCFKDNCPLVPNSDQKDNDKDGVGDVCDNDDDNDGIPDNDDNCPLIPNKNQGDMDMDGVGDLCDNCPTTVNQLQKDSDNDAYGDECDVDNDNDGVTNNLDNCPFVANNEQSDSDYDGVGDLCDNCPSFQNPLQQDSNKNGIGDHCDSDNDRDLDGIGDKFDNCPHFPNAGQVDSDVDNVGNSCDSDSDDDGFDDQSDNCPLMHNLLQFDIDDGLCITLYGSDQTINGNLRERTRDLRCVFQLFSLLDNRHGDICEYDYDDDGYDSRVDTCPLNNKIWQTDFRKHDIVPLNGGTFNGANFKWKIRDEGMHVELNDFAPGAVALIGRDVYEGFDFKGVIYIKKHSYVSVESEVGIIFNYQNANKYYLVALQNTYKKSNVTFSVKKADGNIVVAAENFTMHWYNEIEWSFDTPYSVEIKYRPLNNQVKIKIESSRNGVRTGAVESRFTVKDELIGGKIGLYVSHQSYVIWSALKIECRESKI